MKLPLLFLAASAMSLHTMRAADSKIATAAINQLGVELYKEQASGDANVLLSPYSIQVALAMTFAGADGATRAEMQRVLHFPADDNALAGSFSALASELSTASAESVERTKNAKEHGGPSTPFEFNLANRLFAQRGYEFRAPFLALVKEKYDAPLMPMDFQQEPEKSREAINRWVEEQTKNKIRDLVPPNAIKPSTRLALVNALYLRAAWNVEFKERLTANARFLVHGNDAVDVPMMQVKTSCGYLKRADFQVVTRSYDGDLQFVIVLPNDPAGLAAVEKELTPKLLEECAQAPQQELVLFMPKFRLTPPTLPLSASLQKLGMKTAFDIPPGSADFDRMAPRKPQDYLSIGAVLHKTFIALDEKGTEAAAATAVVMMAASAMRHQPPPIEVHVDRPFIFAIQHIPSGACLFLGRVTDPR